MIPAGGFDMQKRIAYFGLAESGFQYQGYPATYWDIFGKKGIQLRTTISEMGPLLLSRLMDLNDLQSDILTIVFKIADDSRLLLIDTKDLKAMLNYVSEHVKDLAAWCQIEYEEGNSYYADNPLMTAKHLYLNGQEVTDLVIPEGVTSINGWTFYFCESLTSINIGNSVTSIGKNAFSNCSNVRTITIGSAVKSISLCRVFIQSSC